MIAPRLYAGCLIMLIGMMALPARAATVFTVGNSPPPGDENVLMNDGATGSTVFAETNNTHLQVQFDSTKDTLTEFASGQARVKAVDGLLNDITVSVPGGTFTSLIFNAFNGDGDATVTATTASAAVSSFTFALGNGENFLTIVASGDPLVSVNIDAPAGFTDLRQVRIGGAALVVPLPSATWAGMGLMAILGVARVVRHRREA